MRILVICPYAPWPAVGGGKLRIFHLVDEWLRSGHSVDVWVAPSDEPDLRWAETSHGYPPGLILDLPSRPRSGIVSKVTSLLSRLPEEVWTRPVPTPFPLDDPRAYDLVVLMQAHVGQFARPFIDAGVPIVLDQQNVERHISREVSRLAPTRMGRLRARLDVVKWRWWERGLVREAACTVAVSEGDAADFRQLAPGATVVVRPSGADLRNRPYRDHSVNRSDALVMTGTLGYLPNLDAAHWMIDDILPRIRERRPGVRLQLVGASAPQSLVDAAPEWVDVVGRVPDVLPYLDGADLFVAPLRAGGGTRLKLLEAFAVGLPVVATTIASSGIEVQHGRDVLTADDAEAFADGVVSLLEDQDRRREIARSARRLVEERYAWTSIAKVYEEDLYTVVGNREHRLDKDG
jgi:polysaccharide biosynthesis protein PslH